jgi:hypothetical protein
MAEMFPHRRWCEAPNFARFIDATTNRRETMKRQRSPRKVDSPWHRSGKIKYGIFAWLIGLPLPIIILALFFRGCDF